MSLRVFLLGGALVLTACGAAPTGRSTMPSTVDATDTTDTTTATPGPAAPPQQKADPSLPDKQVDIAGEAAFASAK